MKKWLIACIVLICLHASGLAQSVKDTVKKSNVKVNAVAAKTIPDSTAAPFILKKDSSLNYHYKNKVKGPIKKDGTIDWGYKPNKKGQ